MCPYKNPVDPTSRGAGQGGYLDCYADGDVRLLKKDARRIALYMMYEIQESELKDRKNDQALIG